jgi:GNAT superfamily N-acetyltransferase
LGRLAAVSDTAAIPVGFSVRPVTLADLDTITALMAESSQAVLGEDDVTGEEVRSDLARPGIDLARDTWLASDVQGRAVGYAEATDERHERAFIDVYLGPDLPDSHYRALGGWLTRACLARIEQLVAESGRSAVTVSTGCYRSETRLAQVLTDAGLGPERVYWRMGIDLAARHLAPPTLPAGVGLRTMDLDDPAEARLAHRLVTEAFRAHFGSVAETFEAFWERARRPAYFDPSLWWVAEVDSTPAGVLIGDNRRREEGSGWVRALGVLEAFRGRGAAKSLLLQAFAEFGRRGLSTVMLGVDAENTTGATALYESVGMQPLVVIDSYAVTLPR